MQLPDVLTKEVSMRRRMNTAAVLLLAVVSAACGESKLLTAANATTLPTLQSTVPSSIPTAESTSTTVAATLPPVETTTTVVFTAATVITVPPTTLPPTTTAPPVVTAPAPTAPPTTATPVPTFAAFGSQTNLRVDTAPLTLPIAGADCAAGITMADFETEQCINATSYLNGVVVLVQRHATTSSRRVLAMFRGADGTTFESRYIAVEPSAGTWSQVTAVVSDHNGDDHAEVWVGYRYSGTGGYLDIDVLDPRPDGAFVSRRIARTAQRGVQAARWRRRPHLSGLRRSGSNLLSKFDSGAPGEPRRRGVAH